MAARAKRTRYAHSNHPLHEIAVVLLAAAVDTLEALADAEVVYEQESGCSDRRIDRIHISRRAGHVAFMTKQALGSMDGDLTPGDRPKLCALGEALARLIPAASRDEIDCAIRNVQPRQDGGLG